MTGFSFLCGLAVLVHFEQVLSDLKRFRTIFGEETFSFKNVILYWKRESLRSGFQYFLRFLKFLTAFRFCAFWPFLVMSAIFK